MTLDSYETKILEIREDIKRKFVDMMKIRAEKYGQLQVGIWLRLLSADRGVLVRTSRFQGA